MDDPTLAPPPRPPFPAAGAAALGIVGAYSATMALWMAGLTVLKENTRLDLFPPVLFDFIIRWYFPLLWTGMGPGIAASLAFLTLGALRRIPCLLALGVPLFLGTLWIVVGWLMIADNIRQVEAGYPFHWPH